MAHHEETDIVDKAEKMFYCHYYYQKKLLDQQVDRKARKAYKKNQDINSDYSISSKESSDDMTKQNDQIQEVIDGKKQVIDYFKFFHSLKDQIEMPIAKREFTKKVNKVVEVTQEEIEKIQVMKPSHKKLYSIGPNQKLFEQWLADNITSLWEDKSRIKSKKSAIVEPD